MAVDLIALAQANYDAFNRGDYESALQHIHPQVEWHTYLVPGPGGGVYRGHDGVRQLWSDVRSVLDDFRNEAEDFFARGNTVVVFVRFCGRGRGSGADVEARLAHLLEFEDGLLRRVQTYDDRQTALAAAGISAA